MVAAAARRMPARRLSHGQRLAAGAAVLLVAAGVAIALADPFGGGSPGARGVADNAAGTSLTTMRRQDLSHQTQVSATLGYADASTVSVPPGTAPTVVRQAQQQSDSASQALQSAQATLAADRAALAQARATLAAEQRKLAADCSGDNAAGTATTPCAADAQASATDQQAVTAAKVKADADARAVDAARSAVRAADESFAAAQSSASTYGQTSVYTMLPPVGRIVHRGVSLYAIDGQPTLLLYGATPASRAFESGMSPGADVAELNANLSALGYGSISGDTFTASTTRAIEGFQSQHHVRATGQLALGSVVFEPGAVRVTSVTPTAGSPVQAGPVLGITSTRRIVTIALDASQQTSIKVGDQVVITLPDNSTTPGHVSFVGTVATVPSAGNGNGSSSPTIEVGVTADHPAATGRLDQAPVNVSITTASVSNVLAVPVNALLALANGGYAVEEVDSAGAHQLVAVSVGLFDDAAGLVEVSGAGLAAGQHVVVPAS
jgi:hypothetical protein